MKIVILCQALLFTILTTALPTSFKPNLSPESSQLPLPLDFPEVESPNSDASPSQSDGGLKQLENPDLFEGDIIASPEETELYYNKQSNMPVRLTI